MSVEAESLTQSAGAILTGNTGLFSLETGTTSGIALDNANGFSNVCLTQSGGTSISAVYRNNGSYTVAANFPGSVTARAAAAGAVITVGTVNSVNGIRTFYAGVPVLLSAPAGIKLVKNISAGGDITFESPVVMGVDTLVSVSSTYLGSAITFESTLNGYTDSGVNKGNLALSAASGSVIFNAPVGGAVRLNTLAIKQGSVSNGASSPALSITADTINLGESAAVDFDTSASANKNITFKTDKVDIQTTGPVSINAGTGSFQISPSTVTKTIEYGDAESLSKDVYYSSDWSAITAAAFIVGGASQTGAVFISEVANTPVTVTFKTAASARVFFEGDYSVADTLPNTVYFETGGITINGGHTIDLKDNAWHAPPPVTLAGTASSSTAVIKAGGGITFDSTVMPDGSANTRNLTLDAASGNVTLGGAAGSSSNKIGDLIIEHNPSGAGAAALVLPAVYSKGAVTAHHNGIVTLNGSITAAGDVSEKGSGGVSFGGSYTITGDSVLLTNNISASGKDIGFTAANSTNKKVNLGGDITISARQIDFNGNINGDSDNDSTANYSLSIDHTGLLNLESVFVSQLTEYGSGGSVRIGGYGIAASALLETENGLSFDNNIVLYQDSDFNSKGGGVTVNSVFSRPSSSFSAVLTADGAVTLNGSIGSTAARMSYIKIEANGLTTQNSVLYSNATSAPPGTGISLNILNITGDLSLDARGAGGAVNIAIEQNILHNGSLAVLAGDFNLDAHNYYMSDTPLGDSGFSGNGSRVLTLGPQTKFIINGVDFKTDSSFAINASPVSTLVINGSCSILLGDRSKQALGGVTIESASTLTAQSDLTVQGDWTQTGGFTHGDKLVEFAGSDVTITGSTSWYKFLCAVPGATIKFSNSGDTHTFENEVRIEGTKERPIVLNAVTVNPSPSPPFLAPTTDFWVIDVSMAASYLFKYVKVYHSYAYPMGINASPNEVWTGTSAPYWTINWKTEFYYIFGFTEDTDGDGRIDRIRVQATETIGGDFGDFRMDVEGYTVTGYDSVGSTFPSPFIYLNVQPQVRHDGNARPALRLVNPGGLIGEVSGRSLGVIQGFTLRAADTTPPRLLYSLTHPDSGQLYMKFSEPVTGTPSLSSPIGSKIFTFAGKADADGLLFSTGDGPFTADDIIADDNAVRYQENIILDVTDTGAGWPADPYALGFTSSSYNPSYPTAADYSGYAPVDISSSWPGALDNDVFSASGMNFQPHPSGSFEWSSGRRVSDILLLAQPPAASSAGSLWPNYAKGANGESLIQQWDGSKTLVLTRNWENKDYSIDMNITAKNNLANADTAPDLIFGFNIPNIYREGKASGNLWLPSIRAEGSFDFAQNFVPQTYAGTDRAGDGTSDVQYHIAENSLKDMNTFDFIFEVPLTASVDSSIPLFAARLDLKNSRWWKLKPFSFIVRDIVRQSGGVSIVNNVLNPLKGGKTKLIYVLTKPGQVTVNVFSLDGVLIRNLYRGHRETGEHFAEWDGRNNGGNAVARGVYFIRIVGPDIDEIRKIMLVK
jgi:hypothetical protein